MSQPPSFKIQKEKNKSTDTQNVIRFGQLFIFVNFCLMERENGVLMDRWPNRSQQMAFWLDWVMVW